MGSVPLREGLSCSPDISSSQEEAKGFAVGLALPQVFASLGAPHVRSRTNVFAQARGSGSWGVRRFALQEGEELCCAGCPVTDESAP